jgi:hypothetical protein
MCLTGTIFNAEVFANEHGKITDDTVITLFGIVIDSG